MSLECHGWEKLIKTVSLIFACSSKRRKLWNSYFHLNRMPILCKLSCTLGDAEHKSLSQKLTTYIVLLYFSLLCHLCSPGNNILKTLWIMSDFENIFNIFQYWIKREYWELKDIKLHLKKLDSFFYFKYPFSVLF